MNPRNPYLLSSSLLLVLALPFGLGDLELKLPTFPQFPVQEFVFPEIPGDKTKTAEAQEKTEFAQIPEETPLIEEEKTTSAISENNTRWDVATNQARPTPSSVSYNFWTMPQEITKFLIGVALVASAWGAYLVLNPWAHLERSARSRKRFYQKAN